MSMNLCLKVDIDSTVYINNVFYCNIANNNDRKWTNLDLPLDNSVVRISNKCFPADSYLSIVR